MGAIFPAGHFISELRQRLDEKPFDIDKSRQLSAYILGMEAKGYSCSPREDRLWEELTWLIESEQNSRAYYAQKVMDALISDRCPGCGEASEHLGECPTQERNA